MHNRFYVVFSCVLALASTTASARANHDPVTQMAPDEDPQDQEKGQREGMLDDLQARVRRLEEQHDEEVDDLTFEIEGLQEEIAHLEARGQSNPQRSNVFNPSITVFGNFTGRVDDGPVHVDDDPAQERVDDQFHLREFEIDFRAAIDPWADGVLIVSYESEVPGESTADIEEGYVTLKKLPIFDSAPAGLKLQVGRFRAGFGRFNQIHGHDLPQSSYPRSLSTFMGAEGYIRDGVSGQFFLPPPSESQAIESTLAVLNGGGIPVAEGQSRSNTALLGHVKWFADLGQGKNVELGLSGWQTDSDHRLYGVDASFKWKPHVAGEWKSFLVGGEFFQADLAEPGLSGHSLGFYVWSQYQFSRNLYLGARYDRTEELANSSLITDTFGTYLTFYTTEFLRLRLGLEHSDSDIALLDDRDTALFEINFVLGSHPVEPYWVNR